MQLEAKGDTATMGHQLERRDVLRSALFLNSLTLICKRGCKQKQRNSTWTASTGISATTPSGAAASIDLLAVVENGDKNSPVRKLINRKQLDAFRYGIAFSRGAVMEEDNVSFIQV
jgi:hypothetical protein